MALNGNELVNVLGSDSTGRPSGEEFPTTTGEIAALNGATVTGYTSQQYFVQNSLTDAASVSWNLNTQQAGYLLLTSAVGATRELENPTNMKAGGTYTLIVQQSDGAPNAMTFDSAYKFPSGTAPTLTAGSSAIDIITFMCDGTSMYGVGQLAFS